ncbi:hypothetical protein [Chamaesiphon polymorphus]|uniref:P pilus assembly/Cpx signaling pathway, periplasmic inhibitor/zinc-resistance associated protein n=1 Tax=Chamaesiphon polymorphus CCALA 037 TaxID=2107692 RepID=A0A2T1F5Y4_9CYAN|nr:hypothetical protein [Chamaesiphon polymorphus]PSB40401.1 hypothetical protein C7B77_28400 [Chamaesiphon polymorphus CCALA 037]
MKNFTLTAALTAICSLSMVATIVTPSFAQSPTKTPATKTAPATTTPATTAPANANNAQAQAIEQLKLTKDQQEKLVKLQQTVLQKQIAVLNPTQKQQLQQAMKEGKRTNFTFTADQQTKLKAIQAEAVAQQNAILTPEQQQKLIQINKQFSTPQQR